MDVPHLSENELIGQLRTFDVLLPETEAALKLAREVHGEQLRHGGGSYLDQHIYPVTLSVAEYLAMRQSSELLPAVLTALLHDVVEDSDSVQSADIERQFGSMVAEWVESLTKPATGKQDESSKREAERRYVDALRSAPFPVRLIKVQDRLNNLAGLHMRTAAERTKYLNETRRHYMDLAEGVDADLARQMKSRLQSQE